MAGDIESDSTTNLAEDTRLLSEDTPETGKNDEIIDADFEDQPDSDDEPEQDDEEEVSESETTTLVLAPHERPSITEVKAKFPEFFKTFPAMRHMLAREREYDLLFPSVKEARESKESLESFEIMQQDIASGDCTKFLSALKDTGDANLMNFSRNVLKALAKVSPDAHWAASVPLLQNVVRAFFNEGLKFGDTDLGNNYKNAASHLSKYLFGDHEIAEGKKSVFKDEPAEKSAEQVKFEKEKEEYETGKFNTFRTGVANKAGDKLKDMVLDKDKDGNLKMDPKNLLSKWMVNTLTDKIISEVGSQMQNDKQHLNYMNSLWAQTKKVGYTSDLEDKIISSFLARAKSLVPAVRSRIVSEATGTAVRVSRDRQETAERNGSRRESGSSGSVSRSTSREPNAKTIDWSRTSDLDLLNDNVTFKKN
jgi:hypothetical protein